MPAGVFNERNVRNSEGAKPNLSLLVTRRTPILKPSLERKPKNHAIRELPFGL